MHVRSSHPHDQPESATRSTTRTAFQTLGLPSPQHDRSQHAYVQSTCPLIHLQDTRPLRRLSIQVRHSPYPNSVQFLPATLPVSTISCPLPTRSLITQTVDPTFHSRYPDSPDSHPLPNGHPVRRASLSPINLSFMFYSATHIDYS